MPPLPQQAPLDPDRDLARSWLAEELSDPTYVLERSWVSRVRDWFADLLPSLDLGAALPPWASWVALALVLAAAVAVISFGARRRWREQQRGRTARLPGPVLEEELDAAAYRARARQAQDGGDLDAALLDHYRALTADADERTLLADRPGLTAHEVAMALAPVFPDEAAQLVPAADAFDAVRYGDHHATLDQVEQVQQLSDRLASARPSLGADPIPARPR